MVWLIVPEHRFTPDDQAVALVMDQSKDVLCEAWALAQGNPYLPKIEFVGADIVSGHPEINGRYSKVYHMKYYRNLMSNDKDQWLEMKRLHKIRADGKNLIYDIYSQAVPGSDPSMSFLGNKAARFTLIMAKKLDPLLYQALQLLYNSLSRKNRQGLTFEFNLRNMGVDEHGHLILRDPVYDSEITVQVQSQRNKE
jgi:hypothetical protein